jgi:hypothetical protein
LPKYTTLLASGLYAPSPTNPNLLLPLDITDLMATYSAIGEQMRELDAVINQMKEGYENVVAVVSDMGELGSIMDNVAKRL